MSNFRNSEFSGTAYEEKYKDLVCDECGRRFGNHFGLDCITSPIKGYPKETIETAVAGEKKVVPIEDLVKTAIKEAISKRRGTETTDSSENPKGLKEAVVEAPEPESVIVEPKEGQIWASKLFKGVISKGKNDFPVTIFKPEDFNEKVRAFIPKVDPTYILNKDHTAHILKAWEMNEKVLVYGPTGAGKSSIVEQLCGYVGRPFIRINCTGDMDSSMIFGQLTAKDGATIWVDGTVTEAVKYGAVFAWDEWDVTPPEIAMGLQWLLEKEGKLFLKEMPGESSDKFIVPHENFRLVALGNTQGQADDSGMHSGTNVQNTATLDRFETVIRIGYMPEVTECEMLKGKHPEKKPEDVSKLVKFANLIRQGYTTGQLCLTMSPRSTLSVCKKTAYGYSLIEAIELVYVNKLTETHQKVAKELYRKVYGSTKV